MLSWRGTLSLLLFTLISVEVRANVPASYFACEGLSNGYRCRMTGPFFGRCTLDTLCDDDEETASLAGINECLLCVDECWSRAIGSQCVIPLSGDRGVCEEIPNCTPDDEKSFFVCQRCRDGSIEFTQPVEPGCQTRQQWLPRVGLTLGLMLLSLFAIRRTV